MCGIFGTSCTGARERWRCKRPRTVCRLTRPPNGIHLTPATKSVPLQTMTPYSITRLDCAIRHYAPQQNNRETVTLIAKSIIERNKSISRRVIAGVCSICRRRPNWQVVCKIDWRERRRRGGDCEGLGPPTDASPSGSLPIRESL